MAKSREGAAPPRAELVEELRQIVAVDRRSLEARLAGPALTPRPRGAHGDDGVALGVEHAARLDSIMRRLFEEVGRDASADGLALVAVGSYGRGAVALRSDADVRLLARRNSLLAERFAERLLYPLWDAGMSVGHQVATPTSILELAQSDLATATSLLDGRLIAGDLELVRDLEERAFGGVFSEGELGRFMERLEQEVSGRHARFGGSVYLLEPDVKSGAGGLRDLDVARWAARARLRTRDRGAGGFWAELVRMGMLVPREACEIAAAEELFWRVRNRLHAQARRRSDRLTFDQQEAIALDLGYGTGRGEVDESAEGRAAAAERMMQDYYVHARAVTRAREQILARATPPKRRNRPTEIDLCDGVHLFDGHVTLSPAQLEAEPDLAFRAYAACVKHDAPLLPFARESIARAAADPGWCAALRMSPRSPGVFVELVCTVPEVKTRSGSMVRELHDVGLLLAMIPEFLPVTGRVHHDVYHVYTVDVHSVAAVDCLRTLRRGDVAHERPLASRLAAELARPRPIFLATLLHDVGKGYPDEDGSRKKHSLVGARMCEVILPRLGFSQEETDEASSLVEHHLAMYHVATRRDLDDPATAADFVKHVRGREGLRDLYLLTVVDLTTTSPTAMTSWKAHMLDELYFAADAHLAGAPRAADEARLDRVREGARRLAGGKSGLSDEELEAFLSSMPDRYLLANAPEAIVRHAALAGRRGDRAMVAEMLPSRHPGISELCVVATDRAGLLARIAAAITGAKMEVLTAQIYSRELAPVGIEAVDLFLVRDRVDERLDRERLLPRLLADLEALCAGTVSPQELLEERLGKRSPWRERPSPAVSTEIVIDDRASPRHTIIEVFAKDRPGLLHAVAQALYDLGLGIALSKVNTEGTRVADVFYVNERDGAKVRPGERFKEIRERLVAAVTEEVR